MEQQICFRVSTKQKKKVAKLAKKKKLKEGEFMRSIIDKLDEK